MFAAQKRIIIETKQLGLTLMSDLHIGAINVDYKALRSDLDRAREHGDRILINGDVFDAILLHDMKRFRAESLDERSRGRSNILNVVVKRAAEELAPYADLIDMIGCGNHEESVEKYHNYDPIQALSEISSRSSRKESRSTVPVVRSFFMRETVLVIGSALLPTQCTASVVAVARASYVLVRSSSAWARLRSFNSCALRMAIANASAMLCKVVISSLLKARSSTLCTVTAPNTVLPVIKGNAISERVLGKCGFLKCTASNPTSRAIRASRR